MCEATTAAVVVLLRAAHTISEQPPKLATSQLRNLYKSHILITLIYATGLISFQYVLNLITFDICAHKFR